MPAITPQDVEAIGRYLHQDAWRTALAKDLRLDEATLNAWLNGTHVPEENTLTSLIEIVSIRYCTNQIGKVKEKGNFSPSTPLVLKQENNGWSAEVDWEIKQKAIAVLKEYHIQAITEV